MFGFKSTKKKNKPEDIFNNLAPIAEAGELPGIYEEELSYLKKAFQGNELMEFRELEDIGNSGKRACIVFCGGLVDPALIDNHLLRPLMNLTLEKNEEMNAKKLLSEILQINSTKNAEDYKEIIENITYGDALLLIESVPEALLFSTKNFVSRAISEPDGEKILSGPREGFTEILVQNLSMVQRKLRTNQLKMQYLKLGKQTSTQICIAYLEGIAEPRIIKALYERLKLIDIDSVLDANYINELIRDKPWSPFRSTGYTERPDVVTAKLLEGRVAVFVDGTPVVLTIPYLFIENFQSSEDYYLNFYYTTFSRALRILGFFLTVFVPAVYISIVAYHQEMLPSPLLISIAIERQSVPLPAALEAFIMLVIFEILRETALRMPTNVGQAMSIVGALVVGQAAVEAKLVAAPMIIVIAIAGITSLLIPKMNAPILIMRFAILFLASCLGFFGVTIGAALLLAHVLGLKSFGISQLFSGRRLKFQTVKDTVMRAPWSRMLKRPEPLSQNRTRQNESREERI